MASFVISYDLSAPGRDYADLYGRIKSYGTWAHITESTWFIVANRTSIEVRDNLKEALDTNDNLMVAKLTGEAAWRGLSDAQNDWIKKNL